MSGDPRYEADIPVASVVLVIIALLAVALAFLGCANPSLATYPMAYGNAISPRPYYSQPYYFQPYPTHQVSCMNLGQGIVSCRQI